MAIEIRNPITIVKGGTEPPTPTEPSAKMLVLNDDFAVFLYDDVNYAVGDTYAFWSFGDYDERTITHIFEVPQHISSVYDQPWHDIAADIYAVKFEPSFYNYKPTSLAYLCANFSVLVPDSIYGLSSIDTRSVTTTAGMFRDWSSYNGTIDISCWELTNIRDMSSMFSGCSGLEAVTLGDSKNFTTSKLTALNEMFAYCEILQHIYCDVNLSTTSAASTNMFMDCVSLHNFDYGALDKRLAYKGEDGYFEDSLQNRRGKVLIDQNFDYAVFIFDDKTYNVGTSYDFDGWVSFKVGYVYSLDRNAQSSKDCPWLDLSYWGNISTVYFSPTLADFPAMSMAYWFSGSYFSNVYQPENVPWKGAHNISHMFSDCKFSQFRCDEWGFSPGGADIDYDFAIGNATGMFSNCINLTSCWLNNMPFQSLNITNEMFSDCAALQHIYVSERWDNTYITSATDMFKNCRKLHKFQYSKLGASQAYVGIGGYLEEG